MWREDVSRAISTASLSSLSSCSQVVVLLAVGASAGVSVGFGNRCCSAGDSADALAHVESMEKNRLLCRRHSALKHVSTAVLHLALGQAQFSCLCRAVGYWALVLSIQRAKWNPSFASVDKNKRCPKANSFTNTGSYFGTHIKLSEPFDCTLR